MSMRAVRRRFTSTAVRAGYQAAPWLPECAVKFIQATVAGMGSHTPVLSRQIIRNMRAVGIYTPEIYHAHFRQIALHLANAIRVFRWNHSPEKVASLAREHVDLDPSIDVLRSAIAAGNGVLLAPAHTVDFVLTLSRLNQEVPVCVFLRWSDDEAKLRMKQEWCRAAGLEVVLEPPSSASPTLRAGVCIDVLREGKVLAITPDIAQKSSEGTPVRLFGRQAYLPTGAAALAMLAESPMIPLFGRLEGERQFLYTNEPIHVRSLTRAEGGRPAALQLAMQQWATQFEAFVRRCPPAWFLWGDSRWTRVFQNDPKYATMLDGA